MSQFLVSARKYRPQKFDELVGQQHVANTLKNAMANNQLAHAFLFCGPRGVGKTSCARILARVLNCENKQNQFDPCGECNSCKSFNDNASFNIIELDAASNNSVEHIRNLTEQVRFQPQRGTHKVFIIDEVHMLSSQAFNAFLKTLEEPPPYAVFILATTEKHKILPTILSRCQIFDFRRIQVAAIVEQLVAIAQKEGVKYDEEALSIIAQKSDGAMRDALSIFDKLVSSTDKEISYQEVIENLNILDYDYFFKLTDAFLKEDISEVMLKMDEILRKGFDPELCLLGLAEHMRELLLSKKSETQALISASESLKKRYHDQGQLCSTSFLMSSLSILNQADINFQRAKNKRLHAEISLSKITYLNRAIDSVGTTPAVKPIQNNTPQAKGLPTPTETKVENKVMAKSVGPSATVAVKKKMQKIGFSSDEAILQKIAEEEKEKQIRPKQLNLEIINQIWQDYYNALDSQTIKTSLKAKKIEISSPNRVVIYVPSPNAHATLTSEFELLQNIRDAFDIEMLQVEPILNNDLFPEYKKFVHKKPLSGREIYDKLVEKNPNVKKLKEAFELKVDS